MESKRYLLSLFLGLFVISIQAQVTFVLEFIPEYTPAGDDIYIAGSFNGWNPADSDYMLAKNNDNKWSITLDAETDGTTISFKFTRGSWETVEKGSGGEEIDNRSFTFGNGLTEHLDILNWADNNGGGGSTAAENVSIVDEDYYMPQLDRERRIWIYLPPDYQETETNYPVLYMHDGQNLFDAQTSFAGEWEVDETLNELANEGYLVPIVIGIDNGGTNRIDEYTPWIHPSYGGGDGDKYMAFIVETLKPYLDENYRTLADRDNTGIMGSSLGGLISHYGSLKNQAVFSKAGIFSPSYWFSDSVWSFTAEMGKREEMKFYMMCGNMEGVSTVPDMLNMADTLESLGFYTDEVKTKIVPNGEHNEQLWRQEFREAYLSLFTEFAYDVPEGKTILALSLHPNPVDNEVTIVIDKSLQPKSTVITDSSGKFIKQIDASNTTKLDVGDLSPGVYFIRLKTNEQTYLGKFIKK